MRAIGPAAGELCSFSIAKYGSQQSSDPWWSDVGNGIRPDGSAITNNDLNDAYVQDSSSMQQQWERHITNQVHRDRRWVLPEPNSYSLSLKASDRSFPEVAVAVGCVIRCHRNFRAGNSAYGGMSEKT
jgi:hypothetical protein